MYEFGRRFKVDLFGRSHAERIGCIVTGLPKGVRIDMDRLNGMMALRSPRNDIGTSRREPDEVIFEEGVTDGVVTGSSVLIVIPNKDVKGQEYETYKTTPRPGHADLPALFRFKDFDISGGGQFSGRMTAPLVAAGSIAIQYLESKGIRIAAYTRSISDASDDNVRTFDEIAGSTGFDTRAADAEHDSEFKERILSAKSDDDSVGGVVSCMIEGLPIGFGGEWSDSLDSLLARSMFSIPGVKGVEFGAGFGNTKMRGSISNDPYRIKDGEITTETNNMGGICGGMCNGSSVTFNVAFKPTPSIGKEQRTVNLENMENDTVSISGRHDPCIVPRAVPVVEAMAAITVLDLLL